MPWWESSLFWGVAGIVAGFLISTTYYLISKERISMKHSMTSKSIINKETLEAAGVNLVFDNQLINQLIETTVKFTNSGNRTIDPFDYASKEPLGVHILGHLFRYNAWAENKNSIPEIKPMGDDKYKVEFDFLKPKQAFSITLFHDGAVDVFGELRSGSSRRVASYTYIESSHIDFDSTDMDFDLADMDFDLAPMESHKHFEMRSKKYGHTILSRAIKFCILVVSGVVIYFVMPFKPLFFAVVGAILGMVISSLLFSFIEFKNS